MVVLRPSDYGKPVDIRPSVDLGPDSILFGPAGSGLWLRYC